MKKKTIICLILILILGAFLRFYQMGQIPNSINADEASLGYNAYSILKTAKDEYGKKLPLIFTSFDDHKNPVYVYMLVPFIKIFGFNSFALKLPNAMLGTLSILLFFLLTKKLIKNNNTALISAFLAAICPWLIHYSRIGFEMNTAFFLSLLGVWLFLSARQKDWLYIPSAFIFSLAFWCYHPTKLWITLFGFFLVVFTIIDTKKITKGLIVGLIIFLLFAIPNAKLYLTKNISSRSYGISVFKNEQDKVISAKFLANDIEKQNIFGRLIHNRRLVPINQLINGYMDITSPKIIFDQDIPNHIQKIRLMYLWMIPLIILGLAVLFKKSKKVFVLILVWLFFGYIPGAITILPGFDRRIFVNSFPLIFLGALGLTEIIEFLEKQKNIIRFGCYFAMILCLLFSFISFSHFYFNHGKKAVIDLWGNGMEELVRETSILEDKFENIIVSTSLDQPYIYFLFYKKYPPEKYLSEGGTISGSIFSDKNKFGKYSFTKIDQGNLDHNTLYITKADENIPGLTPIKQILDTNNKPVANISTY